MKETLLGKITRFFSKVAEFFNRRLGRASFEDYSKFKEFLMGLDTKDAMYQDVKTAAELCDEALVIARQRVALVNRIQQLEESIAELDCFIQLTDDDALKLKNLLDRFVALSKERDVLRNQIIEFDRNIVKMEGKDFEAEDALSPIAEAEKTQRILDQDISYLKTEKTELDEEREILLNGYSFINRLSLVVVVGFSLAAIVLGYLFIFDNARIFYPITVLILVMMVLVSVLFSLRKKIQHELKVNLKKQHRAVEMINKKSAVYAHYANYLGYEYSKYKVKNSHMLKSSISEYRSYKNVSARMDNIRNIMYETERLIEVFLREKNIAIRSTIEKFAENLNIDDKRRRYAELMDEKKAFESNLTELDSRHEAIWDALVSINEKDKSFECIIDKIIQTYLNEAAIAIGG